MWKWIILIFRIFLNIKGFKINLLIFKAVKKVQPSVFVFVSIKITKIKFVNMAFK